VRDADTYCSAERGRPHGGTAAALDAGGAGWLDAGGDGDGCFAVVRQKQEMGDVLISDSSCPLRLVLALIMGGILTLRYQFNGCDFLDLPPSLPFYIGIDYGWYFNP
jgi:hypothetical protein